MRGQVRPGPAAKMAAANSAEKEKRAEKKEAAKAFLKKKADQTAGRDQAKPAVKKEESTTKKVVEAKAPVKAKKEAVLAEARKKIGASEDKRADFKKRSAEAKAKREQKTQTQAAKTAKTTAASSTPATGTASIPAATTTAPGPLKRADMDPNRSVMVQRVNQQMANTGATREEARGAVVARRDARQQQLNAIQSEQGVGRGQAVGIMKYGNKTAVAPEGGGPAVANYQLAKRVVQMANNKGLTRKEAAGVIASRKQTRQAAAAPAQTPIV